MASTQFDFAALEVQRQTLAAQKAEAEHAIELGLRAKVKDADHKFFAHLAQSK